MKKYTSINPFFIILNILGLCVTGELCWSDDLPSAATITSIGTEGKKDSPTTPGDTNKLTNQIIPAQFQELPGRPGLLFEAGPKFLETGPLFSGITIPTGAVWQPSFHVFGTYRTAVQSFYNGNEHLAEWANRFDLFSVLYLTQSERIVAGTRFLDKKGKFSSYTLTPPPNKGKRSDTEGNFILNTLFFEGDFAELFPHLDRRDKHEQDFYFSIGRQPLFFQDGMLINDNVDALSITKINLKFPDVVNVKSSFVWGGGEINRSNLASFDRSSSLFGFLNEIDFKASTVEVDSIFVQGNKSTGDGVYTGFGASQRLGRYSTIFRVLTSSPINNRTNHNKSGILLFNSIGWTPYKTDNWVYINTFKGINGFRSASRDPSVGGPLGPVGILFESAGIGKYGAPLNNQPDDAAGGAIGYQMFFDDTRKQLILELDGRYATSTTGQKAVGPGVRYQMAIGKNAFMRIDNYFVYDPNRKAVATKDNQYRFGERVEFAIRF